MKGEAGFDTEFRIVLPDESIRHIRALAILQRDEKGNPIRLVGTNLDITEKIIAQKMLRRVAAIEAKSKEMEQFAYIASHDLKEPLMTIKGLVEILEQDHTANMNSEGKMFLSYVNQSVDRMEVLINDLLDYSQLSKTKELEEVDSHDIIRMIEVDLHSSIAANAAKIVLHSLPKLKVYPLEFKLLFQNLISNSIKFRKKDNNPEIVIQSKKICGGWQFEVSDNGIGIPQHDQERIFIIFQKLHGKSEYEGTGIGLAHVKKIVELHNGRIEVASDVNQGTTFRFSILTDDL